MIIGCGIVRPFTSRIPTKLGGEIYSGEDSRPFFFSRFGEEDAERFKLGETAVVRVDPQEPQEPQRSILRRADQKNPARLSE
jgi:hypothetical protein